MADGEAERAHQPADEKQVAEYRARLWSYLFAHDRLWPSPFQTWVLRRGLGAFVVLPADVRRIIYRMCVVPFVRAVPNAVDGGRLHHHLLNHEPQWLADGSPAEPAGWWFYRSTTPLGREMGDATPFGRWASARLFGGP